MDEDSPKKIDEKIRLLKIEKNKEIECLHWQYILHNKKKIFIMDMLLVFALLFNIGALMITHALVMKEHPTAKLVEQNPVQGKINGFETSKNPALFNAFLLHCLAWTLIICNHLYNRSRVYNTFTYWIFSSSVIFLIVVTAFDFFNDAGFWIGKLIWGL